MRLVAGIPPDKVSVIRESTCAVLAAAACGVVLPPVSSPFCVMELGIGSTDCAFAVLGDNASLVEVSTTYIACNICQCSSDIVCYTLSEQEISTRSISAGGHDVDRAFDELLGGVFGRGLPGDLNLYSKASRDSVTKVMVHFDVAKHSINPESDVIKVDIANMLVFLLGENSHLQVGVGVRGS